MNWLQKLFHRHKWGTWRQNAVGRWQKRDGDGSEFYCRGEAQICINHPLCFVERFVPDDKRLNPVEGEMVLFK